MDFTYELDPSVAGAAGIFAGASLVALIPACIVSVLMIVSMWKIFTKAGKPGWAALIPIYNDYVLYEIVCGRGLAMFRLLIPLYNIYWLIKTYINLGKAFGKESVFALGLIFLNPIFMCILGFDKSEYLGPQDM